MSSDKRKLVIFDGNALIHRAFHALPPLTTKGGEVVNAVYGFLLVFLRALKEFRPEFVVVTFDFPAPSFRHKKYELYKAKRKKAPDELYAQIPKTRKILEELGIQVFEKEGYEADDVMGTIASSVASDKNLETVIVSGDLDTLQLVNPTTKVYALKRGVKDIVLYDEAAVRQKYEGIGPKQLSDFKALRGDPSDNIPGVFGIGEKTALQLLREFGSVENLYEAISNKSEKTEEIKDPVKKRLIEHKEKAFLSKMLAELEYNVPINFDIEKCRWQGCNKEKVEIALGKYGFHSLIKRFAELSEPTASPKKKKTPKKSSPETSRNNLKLW